MVNERYSIAITETLHYLKGINQDDINKIPNKFMIFLKENASTNYDCDFDYHRQLKELNLTNEAKGLIAMICLNYWCESEEQKEYFKNKLNKNEVKYQEELRIIYNPDSIFRKDDSDKNILNTSKEKMPIIEWKEQKWYSKFWTRILNIFRKN